MIETYKEIKALLWLKLYKNMYNVFKVPMFRLNLQPSSGESEKIIRKRHVTYSVPNSNLLLSFVPQARFRNSYGKCMPSSRFSGFLQVLISQASRMRRLRQLALVRRILDTSQETVCPERKQCSAKADFCECLCSTAFWCSLRRVENLRLVSPI